MYWSGCNYKVQEENVPTLPEVFVKWCDNTIPVAEKETYKGSSDYVEVHCLCREPERGHMNFSTRDVRSGFIPSVFRFFLTNGRKGRYVPLVVHNTRISITVTYTLYTS